MITRQWKKWAQEKCQASNQSTRIRIVLRHVLPHCDRKNKHWNKNWRSFRDTLSVSLDFVKACLLRNTLYVTDIGQIKDEKVRENMFSLLPAFAWFRDISQIFLHLSTLRHFGLKFFCCDMRYWVSRHLLFLGIKVNKLVVGLVLYHFYDIW